MVQLALRGAMGVLLSALAAGCLGGQTGQPSSGTCESSQVSPSEVWRDTTVRAAAATFAGTYEAPLLWQQEPLSASAHTPIDFQDRLQLTIAYDGASVLRDCSDRLTIPVKVTLTTGGSGIAESGEAALEIAASSGALAGKLSYEGERVALEALLAEVARGVTLAGSFESIDQDLPGASASFAVEP